MDGYDDRYDTLLGMDARANDPRYFKRAVKKKPKKKAKKSSKVLIELKEKPKKPKPKKLIRSKSGSGLPLEITLEALMKKFNVTDPKDIRITQDGRSWRVVAQVPETDEQFSKRLAKYEKDLASWQKWYDKNRDLIEKEVKRRKEEVKKKKEKELSELDNFLG